MLALGQLAQNLVNFNQPKSWEKNKYVENKKAKTNWMFSIENS